jgi:hypothetical protein
MASVIKLPTHLWDFFPMLWTKLHSRFLENFPYKSKIPWPFLTVYSIIVYISKCVPVIYLLNILGHLLLEQSYVIKVSVLQNTGTTVLFPHKIIFSQIKQNQSRNICFMYVVWYPSIDLKLLPFGNLFVCFLNFFFISNSSIFASQCS